MASARFAGLVLGVIIVSLALKYSFACAHEGTTRKSKWFAGIESQNHASSQKDFLDDVSGPAVANNIPGRKALKGRKMEVLIDGQSKEESDRKQGLDEKPKISGNYASKSKSKSYLDAADEVVKVMHRDYAGQEPPHRTPPVNNQKPTN